MLLLDEPTTFLDLRYQVELLDIVRDLADDHGIAVGVVLHDLDQAAAIADDVVLLVDGRVVAVGTAARRPHLRAASPPRTASPSTSHVEPHDRPRCAPVPVRATTLAHRRRRPPTPSPIEGEPRP